MSRPVRVRFAPSPTGLLHIGGARTALFNWAFARKHRGTLILRIEDTDTERNSEESLNSILQSMKWLGMDWEEGPGKEGDFGPYFQSERAHLYTDAIQKGLKAGWLYRCFCTAERVNALKDEQRARKENPRYDRACMGICAEESDKRAEAGESHVIRFAVPADVSIQIQDHIRGEVTVQSSEVEDWVAVRSNQMPTYNFCCVVDDAAMEISHVIRGEEHLANTPKQVLLYDALGLPQPEYAHVPLILGANGKKLSKRTGDTALEDYRGNGYPKEALLNFLGLLGFSIDDETTVFTMAEMVDAFSLKRINPSGAIFDTDKLLWLCGDWIRRMPLKELRVAALPWLEESGLIAGRSPEWVDELLTSLQERVQLLSEFPAKAKFLEEPLQYEAKATKALAGPEVTSVLNAIADALDDAPDFTPQDFSILAKEYATKQEIGMGKVMKPVRAALTGTLGGPDLGQILALLGKDVALKRLRSPHEAKDIPGK